jgi:hypothetical protein
MNCVLDRSDILFLVVVAIATYAYAAFFLSKTPDPATQYGLSLNAMMAFLVALGISLVALVIVLIAGVFGYIIVAVIFPPVIFKIIKKMTSKESNATA